MIEVRIPKEIRDYKEKLFFGLNVRQSICIVLSIVICVPLYFFGKNYINEELLGWIIILIAVPIMMTGFFKYNEMYFFEFLKTIIMFNYINQKRNFDVNMNTLREGVSNEFSKKR
jgi:hypothetical protein